MKLHDFLSERSIPQQKFAQIVTEIANSRYGLDTAVTQQAISKICKRDFLPRRKEIVCAIYVATEGLVTPNDFFDLPPLDQPVGAAA